MVVEPIKRKLQPGQQFFNNHGQIVVVEPKQEVVQQDNRDSKVREESHKKSVQVRKQEQMKRAEEQTAQVAEAILKRTMPSYWIQQATGQDLGTVGSLVADLASPLILGKGLQLTGKGLQLAGKGANKLARFGVSPYTGKWTQFGNRQYRLKSGYLGMNSTPIESRGVVPQITAENVASIIPEQWTAAQDAAIARGDMTEAQRLRDLHAYAVGKHYSGYHGNTSSVEKTMKRGLDPYSTARDLNKRGGSPGYFNSSSENVANTYNVFEGAPTFKTYTFMDNPYVIDANGRTWRSAEIVKNPISGEKQGVEAPKVVERIRREGKHDGVIIKNIMDVGPARVNLGNASDIADDIVGFPGRIKSADAVTYNNGVRIPLGERDNFNINDIRYGWQGNRHVQDQTTLEGIQNFIDNDIIPRIQAQGHNVSSYTPTFRQFSPKTDAFDEAMSKVNSGSGAWFTPASNDITIRGPLEKQDFGLTIHEAGGHGLRYNMQSDYVPIKREYLNEYIITGGKDMSDKTANALLKMHTGDQVYNTVEAQKLRESYPWIKTYFEKNPTKKSGDAVLRESGSVNTQFRSHYSNNGKIVGKELDKVIDKASPGVVLRDLIEQPYTSSIIEDIAKITGKDPDALQFYGPEMLEKLVNQHPELQKIVSKVRDTMKTVGSYGIPITVGGSTAATLYNTNK